jgi:hypothetical protein
VSSAHSEDCIKRSVEIAAYLDGELDRAARSGVEQHLKACPACSARLREQQRLLCALDFALTDDLALRLPANFSQVVAAQAQSDMSGLRQRAEHRRALRLCLILTAASVVLLGGATMNEAARAPAIFIGKSVISLFDLLWQMLHGAGTGVIIILRAVSHLIFDSHPLGLLALLLFASALASLQRLIISYHRRRTVHEDGV